ncbi:MAG: hypothetical protein ABEH38_06450 [Flavobacteriales bacterium]
MIKMGIVNEHRERALPLLLFFFLLVGPLASFSQTDSTEEKENEKVRFGKKMTVKPGKKEKEGEDPPRFGKKYEMIPPRETPSDTSRARFGAELDTLRGRERKR